MVWEGIIGGAPKEESPPIPQSQTLKKFQESDSFPRRALGNSTPELVGENRADEKYPVVSAASILAKVDRDRIIAELCEEYGDFGSGYPSDPKTQRFLREWFSKHHGFLPIVRRKWSTVKRLVEGEQALF